MTLYFILAAIVFAVSAGLTFSTKTVSNQQTAICLVLFPVVYLACGLPLEGLLTHVITAVIAFLFGVLLRITVGIGGGVVRALALTVLWMPGLGLVYEYVTLALILGGAAAAVTMLINGRDTQRIEHYAGVILAVCSGFFVYQFVESPSEKTPSFEVQVTSMPSSTEPVLKLRGPSD